MKYLSLVALLGLMLIAVPGAQAQERQVKTADDPRVYDVADNGTKRWLQTPAIFSSYGYDFSNIEVISNQELNNIPNTRVIRLNNNPGVYLLTQELVKRGIGSESAFREMGFTFDDVVSVNATQFNSYNDGVFITEDNIPITPTTEANLIRTVDNPRVYGVAPNETKRWFRSPAVLHSYGFSFSQVRTVTTSEVNDIPNTKAIRLQGNPGIYRLNDDWTKQGIGSMAVFQNLGLTLADVVDINREEFDSYPTGPFLSGPSQALEWRDYVSEALGFTMEFPESMNTKRTSEHNIRYELFGSSQETGTEVTDGILLNVRREAIGTTSLRDYTEEQTVDASGTQEVIEAVHPVTINDVNGYSATVRSLGIYTHIFLPVAQGEVLHIFYVNPDPNNQGYDEIVNRMVASFTRL